MLTKVLPPLVFPRDFTHQLGREGPRKPLQPAWGKRDKGLSGTGAGGRSGRRGGPVGSNA